MTLLLTTREASAYLRERHGIKRAPITLEKLRTLGGGPTFRKLGVSVYYRPEELSEWAEGRLSRPLRSTSELPDHAV